MRTVVVFFSRTDSTAILADAIFSSAQEPKELIQINVLQQKEKKKFFGLTNQKKIKLIATQTDLSAFDLVFFGSDVEGMSPKRKIPEEMLTYLRECRGIENKQVAVFLSCFGIPGTALQKIQSILQTRSAKIVNTRAFVYLLGISDKQIHEAGQFASETMQKAADAKK